MKILKIIALSVLLQTTANASEGDRVAIESSRVDHVISSTVTDEDYRLFVSLPEGYSESNGETYPAIYILDVDSEGSQQLSYYHSVMAQLPSVTSFVLVGIGFWPDDEHQGLRTAHFTSTNIDVEDTRSFARAISAVRESASERPITAEMLTKWRSGRANQFSMVLRDELVPFMERSYSISSTRTIMGASLAGLFLTNDLLAKPNLFDNYVITSPALWWGDFESFGIEEKYLPGKSIDSRVYLSVGELENSDMLESYELLRRIFEEGEFENLEFQAEIIEGEDHNSVIPASYMNGIEYVFLPAQN